MKPTFLFSSLLAFSLIACQSNKDKELAKQAISIHDEIMPQLPSFDKATIEIDSILENLAAIKNTNPTLDTTQTRAELTTLKADLEAATDNMMTWMKEYSLDSADVEYQQSEIDKVTIMKKQFEDVGIQTSSKLNPFR